jgi:hypothetical protein
MVLEMELQRKWDRTEAVFEWGSNLERNREFLDGHFRVSSEGKRQEIKQEYDMKSRKHGHLWTIGDIP